MFVGVGLVFVLIGVLVLAFLLYVVIKAYGARNWPITDGKIVLSQIDHSGLDDIPSPDVIFEYWVDGAKYEGRNISFGYATTNIGRTLKKYPVGVIVTVYYNPKRPEEAVLEIQSVPNHAGQWMAAGTLMIIAGIFFVLFGA